MNRNLFGLNRTQWRLTALSNGSKGSRHAKPLQEIHLLRRKRKFSLILVSWLAATLSKLTPLLAYIRSVLSSFGILANISAWVILLKLLRRIYTWCIETAQSRHLFVSVVLAGYSFIIKRNSSLLDPDFTWHSILGATAVPVIWLPITEKC